MCASVCLIDDIIRRPFSTRPFHEKRQVIQDGRPKPLLPNLQQKTKTYTRHFTSATYDKYQWLAGSSTLNSLFCWNCLLFGHDRNTSWTKTGYVNLGSFSKAAVAHELSIGHITSSYLLTSFGKVRVDTQIDEQHKNEISLHNQKVEQNRELLKRFINAVCFLSKQELAFRGRDESETSINRGNYVELLKYTAEYDPLLKAHLETSTVFKGVSNRIQNDLIDAVANSLLEEVKLEIKEASFVSVLVDETTDVSNTAQFSIVLRYIHNGETKERFVGYCDVSENRTAPVIAEIIRQYLTEFDCNEKLVAQSYDGAATMAGNINGVQALIKTTHPHALFIHCYAHVLNLVLSHTVNSIRECKIFFSTLGGIAAYFSRSPKRAKFLDNFLQRRLPSVCPTRWNYTKRLVNTVFLHKNDLCEVFTAILNHHNEIEQEMLAPANGFLSTLTDFTFCFLLRTFDKIFTFTSVLYNILQTKAFDIVFCRQKIDEIRKSIAAMRSDFESVYAETIKEVGEPSKRNQINYKQVYCEIFDNINNHFITRFQDYGSLQFLGLISNDKGKYDLYQTHFPQEEFSSLFRSYGSSFDDVRLRNELIVFYSSDEFKGKNPFELLRILSESAMSKCFPQVTHLVALICTIPVSTASVERSFSALKRIKTYARNRTGEKRLSNLAVISIEAALLEDMKRKNTFFERAVEIFAGQERRMDFTFR